MRCAVLGDPIAHSLSPVLHRAAYDVLGLDWTYEALRVPSGGLADLVSSLDNTWRGLSLTMPLKREVLDLVEERSEAVRLAGAANTVVLDGGSARLDNTDLPGAVAAVRERWDGDVDRATVRGGGATAASTGLAMAELGAREITLLARSPERAREAADAVRRHPSQPVVLVGDLSQAVVGDVVVSTIPAAAQDAELVRRCVVAPCVFEVLYDPWPTPLAAAAGDAGHVLVGGLDLLVHQAVLQVELFTGHEVPLEAVRAAGTAALEARASA